jgi:hypothetical protein
MKPLAMSIAIAWVFCCFSSLSAAQGADADPAKNRPSRLPVPMEAQRTDAAARVRQLFEAELSRAASPAAKSTLARKLLGVARDDGDATERFVLLDGAQSLAIKAGDASLVTEVIAFKAGLFAIDEAQVKVEAMDELSRMCTGEQAGLVTDELLAVAVRRLADDDVETAKRLAVLAANAARRSKDKSRQKDAVRLMEAVKERGREIDRIAPWLKKLEENPSDLEAVLHVGKYYCFETQSWDKGLPLLMRGNDAELADLAKRELKSQQDPQSLLALADDWLAYVERHKAGDANHAILRQAERHYQAALPALNGLAKIKATQALDAIARKSGSGSQNWMPIFRSADPGLWNTKTDDGFGRFALPVELLPNNVQFVRIRRQSGNEVIVPITKERLLQTSIEGRYGWAGAGKEMYGDKMLGIIDSQMKMPNKQGQVTLAYRLDGTDDTIFGGWGFGHSQLSGTKQDFAWGAGDPLSPEVVEIAVLCRELNSKELPLLLR